MARTRHPERHRSDRIGWLRAAVLGANDGIVSTASLVAGIAAAGIETRTVLMTGVAVPRPRDCFHHRSAGHRASTEQDM